MARGTGEAAVGDSTMRLLRRSIEENRQQLEEFDANKHKPEWIFKTYADAGVELPEPVKQRFYDVHAFHRGLIVNRLAYMEQELAKLEEVADAVDG